MNKEKLLHALGAIALGQVISLCVTVASFASSAFTNEGIDLPVTQSFVTYVFLAVVFGCIFLSRCQRLQVPWYWYALLGFIDFQGNYLVVKAYQYTSITSVTLLNCWTVPWVMILTRVFIKTKYTFLQIAGAVTCIVGLVMVLFSDVNGSDTGGSKPILGDALVIAGTVFYAMSNVGEEFFVKKRDRVEVVAMLGVFGALISGIEILVLERKELESLDWSYSIVLLFLAFGFSMFGYYSLVPFLLKMSGATLLNLSLLTCNMWSVVIDIFVYHEEVDWLYYVAFGTVAAGLIIYSFYQDNNTSANLGHENHPVESIPYEQLSQESQPNSQVSQESQPNSQVSRESQPNSQATHVDQN